MGRGGGKLDGEELCVVLRESLARAATNRTGSANPGIRVTSVSRVING